MINNEVLKKKIFIFVGILLFLLIIVGGVAYSKYCAEDRPIPQTALPKPAQTFLQVNFGGKDVSYVKSDGLFFFKTFELYLVDGTKIEFDFQGDWEEINSLNTELPSRILPQEIQTYLHQRHPGNFVVGVSRNRFGYSIELDNDLEISFDSKYRVRTYDD